MSIMLLLHDSSKILKIKSFENVKMTFSDDEKLNPSPNQLKNKFILKAKIIEDLIKPSEGICDDEKKDIEALNEGQLHANEKTAKELADLVIYSKASKLKNFASSKKYSSYDKIASINSPKGRFTFLKNFTIFEKRKNTIFEYKNVLKQKLV